MSCLFLGWIVATTLSRPWHSKSAPNPLDTDFRGDSMSKNRVFGPSVIKEFRRFSGSGKLVELS
jgi:hypothetical protein